MGFNSGFKGLMTFDVMFLSDCLALLLNIPRSGIQIFFGRPVFFLTEAVPVFSSASFRKKKKNCDFGLD